MNKIQILSFGPLLHSFSIMVNIIIALSGAMPIKISNKNFFFGGRNQCYAESFIGKFVDGQNGISILADF